MIIKHNNLKSIILNRIINRKNIITVFLLSSFNIILSQSVSVSPNRLYFNVAPGEYKTKKITITNNTESAVSFKITFGDFSPVGNKGKTNIKNTIDTTDVFSCSKYLSASPSFIELGPKESKVVNVTLDLPNIPESENVKWAAMSILQAKEKIAVKDGEKSSNKMGFGIQPVMGFNVHIFQTPPSISNNIENKKLEIKKFAEINKDGAITGFFMEVENTGKAILDCAPFVEMTLLSTGETKKIYSKAFTLLPGSSREMEFVISKDMPKGVYSVIGVIDYRGKEVEAAEIENFVLK